MRNSVQNDDEVPRALLSGATFHSNVSLSNKNDNVGKNDSALDRGGSKWIQVEAASEEDVAHNFVGSLAECKRNNFSAEDSDVGVPVVQVAMPRLSDRRPGSILTGSVAGEVKSSALREVRDRCDHEEISPSQITVQRVWRRLETFYKNEHPEIKESHGLLHINAVFDHARRALDACKPPLPSHVEMEILIASLLHDVDDCKYFGRKTNEEDDPDDEYSSYDYKNAKAILKDSLVPETSWESVLFMIDCVSCSKNGNSVPQRIEALGEYHWLIPRWADRIEAVGAQGVVRCYKYTLESGQQPLWSDESPRPETYEELMAHVTPERFQAYQDRGGSSADMISHYYDKLLHVACPPQEIVQNPYLEEQLRGSANELIEVCLRFGRTGRVDEDYIQQLGGQVQVAVPNDL